MRRAAALLMLATCYVPVPPVAVAPAPLPREDTPLDQRLELPRTNIHTVYVSLDMQPDCRIAAMVAAEQIRALGNAFKLSFVHETHAAMAPEPALWTMTIRAGVVSDPSSSAETYLWIRDDLAIERADLVLVRCSPEVILHHLAHVFAATHDVDYEKAFHAVESEWAHEPSERIAPAPAPAVEVRKRR